MLITGGRERALSFFKRILRKKSRRRTCLRSKPQGESWEGERIPGGTKHRGADAGAYLGC